MDGFLQRQEALLPGSVQKLASSCAVILGLGGVGGHAAEALARAGIGRLILIDSDTVKESNRNRQIIALTSTEGRAKVDVMRERILQINPSARVDAVCEFITEENIPALIPSEASYIVDAIDTVSSKLAVAVWAQERGIPEVSCMGTGNKLHPELFRVADIYDTSVCPLCRVMRRELAKRGIRHLTVVYSEEIPIKCSLDDGESTRHIPGSVSFVPGAAGLILAGVCVRGLLAK